MQRTTYLAAAVLVGAGVYGTTYLRDAEAQSMPNKWDQKCLDDASKRFISCMASATTEVAKQRCQETMDSEKKQCKK
jgi:hypothetical protein